MKIQLGPLPKPCLAETGSHIPGMHGNEDKWLGHEFWFLSASGLPSRKQDTSLLSWVTPEDN